MNTAGGAANASAQLSNADKRKSVTYAPTTGMDNSGHGHLGFGIDLNGNAYARAGAKSMPASRRTSQSEHDEELASHLQKLSMVGQGIGGGMGDGSASPMARMSPQTLKVNGNAYGAGIVGSGVGNGSGYNAGMLLDEQLDKEMQSKFKRKLGFSVDAHVPISFLPLDAMRHMPIGDDDKIVAPKSKVYLSPIFAFQPLLNFRFAGIFC
jgi:hypothetical protein